MSEHRTYRASDIEVMGCVLDFLGGGIYSIKRGRPEMPMVIPDLIWESAPLIETPAQLFARNAIHWPGRSPGLNIEMRSSFLDVRLKYARTWDI